MDKFSDKNILWAVVLIITAGLVHGIKAGRLYLALYGSDIAFGIYIKIYCKTSSVSMLIPFKLGEFFRMYCYGKQLGNVLKGIVIILLDRFMDTIALITAIVLVWLFNGEHITSLVCLLLLFLIFALLIYFVFPGLYKFWKKYLLHAKASENKLAALKALEALNIIYFEIESVIQGKGIILYFLSLIAWAVEIGSIKLMNEVFGDGELDETVSSYLVSAINGNGSIRLKQFVLVSVMLLIVIYAYIKAVEIVSRKKADR